jgi:hypothetical protein
MSKDNTQIFREHGDGWEALLAPILEEADRVDATIMQAKEKFGRLRVYFDPGAGDTDKLEDLIDQAEKDSSTVCELCGRPGVLMDKGHWLKTLCPTHALDLGYKTKV